MNNSDSGYLYNEMVDLKPYVKNSLSNEHSIHKKENVLSGKISLPAAIVKQEVLENNTQWMKEFANLAGVLFAPHVKTSMTPYIMKMQLESGAWGLSVANAKQAYIAAKSGAKKILLVNQLIGEANMEIIACILKMNIELYVCVDSIDNAQQLSNYFESQNLNLSVLIEVGVENGRCGVRTSSQAETLASFIKQANNIQLCGIEFYEGVLGGEQNAPHLIAQFVNFNVEIYLKLRTKGLIEAKTGIITGAGAAWYDIVAETLSDSKLEDTDIIIRPGCYITLDEGIYAEAQQKLLRRSKLAGKIDGQLSNALQVVAYVQSLPEKNIAIIAMGKRDCAFDAGLANPIAIFRDNKKIAIPIEQCKLYNIMDQHSFMSISSDEIFDQLKVGDIITFSTSHPCLTFDKWQNIILVDQHYDVIQHLKTYF